MFLKLITGACLRRVPVGFSDRRDNKLRSASTRGRQLVWKMLQALDRPGGCLQPLKRWWNELILT